MVAWIGIGLHIYSVTSQVSIAIPPVVRTYSATWALHGYPSLVGSPNNNIANYTLSRELDQNTRGLLCVFVNVGIDVIDRLGRSTCVSFDVDIAVLFLLGLSYLCWRSS